MNFRYDIENEKLVVSSASRIEYHQISIWLDRFVKGYRFMPAFKMGVWNGKQSYFDNGKVNLGLWKECYKACKEIGVTFNIENRDEFPINRDVTLDKVKDFCNEFFKNHKYRNKKGEWEDFRPHDYQIETAYKILKNRYCLASVATSGGKSLIISIVYFYTIKNLNPDAKLLIIVPSITLVSQFYEDIRKYFYGENNLIDLYDYEILIELEDGSIVKSNPSDVIETKRGQIKLKEVKTTDIISNIKVSKISKLKIDEEIRVEEVMSEKPRKPIGENPNIYIGTYQSLIKYPKNFFHQFHTVACDESHQAKATTLKNILSKTFKYAYNRFGVSGTFPEDDSLEILSIQSVLGPIITEVSAAELVKSGTITPMSIKSVILNHNQKDISDRLKYARKQGAGAEVFRYEKDFIQQSEKRLEFIKKLVDKCDNNTLILFHTIEYGNKILDKLKSDLPDKEFYYIDGEVSGKKRNEIKKEMEKTDGKVKILIASFGTLAVGVSINAIFNVIFVDSFKSEQIIIQSIGRALRKHDKKKTALIFDIVDVFSDKLDNILYKHYVERKRFYTKRNYPFKEIKVNI